MPRERNGEPLERGDVHVRSIALGGLTIAFGVMIFAGFAYGLIYLFAPSVPRKPYIVSHEAPPPPPRLQVQPKEELEQFRQEKYGLLNSYGWVDEKAGVIHIPIDRAMALLAGEETAVRPSASGPSTPMQRPGRRTQPLQRPAPSGATAAPPQGSTAHGGSSAENRQERFGGRKRQAEQQMNAKSRSRRITPGQRALTPSERQRMQ